MNREMQYAEIHYSLIQLDYETNKRKNGLDRAIEIKKRPCLKCGLKFQSSSHGNRFCSNCALTNAKACLRKAESYGV